MNKEEFAKFLRDCYIEHPSQTLSAITKNRSYMEAGDEATLNTFDRLDKVITDDRIVEWHKNRYEILVRMHVYGAIGKGHFLERLEVLMMDEEL